MNPTKEYLGDGCYAEIDESRMLRLTTENGISVTNEIYLDGNVLKSLEVYLKSYRSLIS